MLQRGFDKLFRAIPTLFLFLRAARNIRQSGPLKRTPFWLYFRDLELDVGETLANLI